jgi:hypothetical protein
VIGPLGRHRYQFKIIPEKDKRVARGYGITLNEFIFRKNQLAGPIGEGPVPRSRDDPQETIALTYITWWSFIVIFSWLGTAYAMTIWALHLDRDIEGGLAADFVGDEEGLAHGITNRQNKTTPQRASKARTVEASRLRWSLR